MKYRKKPVVIEAFQFDGTLKTANEIQEWAGAHKVWVRPDGEFAQIIVPTLEGKMRANPGDWIIRGVKGEFYPCKPDIFEATHEPADAQG